MKYTLPVITRLQDCGDGGYSLFVYNSEEELLADHPLAEDGELTDQQKKDILTEDDPYENGYIGREEIEIEVDEQGVPRLASGLYFHCGQ